MATLTSYHLSSGSKHCGDVDTYSSFTVLHSYLVQEWESMLSDAEGTEEEDDYRQDLARVKAATTVDALNELFHDQDFFFRSEAGWIDGGPREITTSTVEVEEDEAAQEHLFEVVAEEDNLTNVYSASELRAYIKEEAITGMDEEADKAVEAEVDAATDEELPALLSHYSGWNETATIL